MADMRKLMEAVNSQINEGWDPGAIADAIYDEYNTEGSPLQAATVGSDNFYKDLIYAYADGTGLFNARAIDGSEIWHSIVDSLEDSFAQHVTADDYKRAEMGEDADDGDVESKLRSNNEFYNDILSLTEEGLKAYDDLQPEDAADPMGQVLQDIDNIVRLHANGRGYAPIHEAFGDDPDPYSGYRQAREATLKLHDMMDEGMLDARHVADAALRYMSEADVADMAEAEGLFGEDEY